MQVKHAHAGWQPSRLREHREAMGLTLEAAGEELRRISERHRWGLAANFQTIGRHERGESFPHVHYRRAYALLYQADDAALGFRAPKPGAPQPGDLEIPGVVDGSNFQKEATRAIQEALTRISSIGPPSDKSIRDILESRVLDAWSSRFVVKAPERKTLTLVGGYAGSGKTEFARFLSDITGWALLDKDSLTRCMAERLLVSLGGDPSDRHSPLYMNEVRPLEYRCLMETTFDNLDCGVSTVLSAPFIAELNQESWLLRLKNKCAARGVEVAVLWVRCDLESMREYLEFRAAPRDTWKLQNWEEYAATLDTEKAPSGVNITVDNRYGTAIATADRTRESLRRMMP
ncbi:AAA family ATPase [Spongiactinospora sp. 9N601]|uniref:AAA family ATPase n=1 Tax=Spongiactinospora sp. 9N601 TaxID=3375149 RepID=UPI0037A26B43